MHELRPSIHAQLPWLCFRTRALLDAALLNRGAIGRAEQVAARLGLGSRFHLARLLRAHGLPPLHRLSGWITVLNWAWNWERRACPSPTRHYARGWISRPGTGSSDA